MIVILKEWKKRIGAGVLALAAAGVASTGQAEIVSPVLRDSLTFMPPHVAGDADFSGNGPTVNVKVKFTVSNNTLL
jgi:hypothetical protein